MTSAQKRFECLLEEMAGNVLVFDDMYQKMPDDFCPSSAATAEYIEMHATFRGKEYALAANVDAADSKDMARKVAALKFSLWHVGQMVEFLWRQATVA